jgi:hypothetical protein
VVANKKNMKQEIEINLKGSNNKFELLKRFYETLGMPNLGVGNWDAFSDDIRSLHTESSIVIEKKPKEVHFIIQIDPATINAIESDYKTLLEILSDATNPEQRHDKIKFTFELAN